MFLRIYEKYIAPIGTILIVILIITNIFLSDNEIGHFKKYLINIIIFFVLMNFVWYGMRVYKRLRK